MDQDHTNSALYGFVTVALWDSSPVLSLGAAILAMVWFVIAWRNEEAE